MRLQHRFRQARHNKRLHQLRPLVQQGMTVLKRQKRHKISLKNNRLNVTFGPFPKIPRNRCTRREHNRSHIHPRELFPKHLGNKTSDTATKRMPSHNHRPLPAPHRNILNVQPKRTVKVHGGLKHTAVHVPALPRNGDGLGVNGKVLCATGTATRDVNSILLVGIDDQVGNEVLCRELFLEQDRAVFGRNNTFLWVRVNYVGEEAAFQDAIEIGAAELRWGGWIRLGIVSE